MASLLPKGMTWDEAKIKSRNIFADYFHIPETNFIFIEEFRNFV